VINIAKMQEIMIKINQDIGMVVS